MAQSLTTTDLKELLGFPFKDVAWKNKFLIGSLVVLVSFVIPVVPYLALYGYMMQIMRRVIVEEGEPFLPEWNDWGKLLTDGLKLFGAVFIYMLPIFILLAIGFGFMFVLIIAMPLLAEMVNPDSEGAGALFSLMPLASSLVILIVFSATMLFGLALGLIMPAIMGHVVATDDFSAAFRWREWWPVFRTNLSGFLMAQVVVLALSFGINSVLSILYYTIIFCCLLPIILAPVTIYISVIQGVIYAQAYREGTERLKSRVA